MSAPGFTMTCDVGNAAFDGEEERRLEIARLLTETAMRVLRGEAIGTLFDANGNRVGDWSFPECEEEDDG